MIYLPTDVTPTPIDNAFIERVALEIGQEADQQAFFPGVVQAEIAAVLVGWIVDAYSHDQWQGQLQWVAAQPGMGKSVFRVGF